VDLSGQHLLDILLLDVQGTRNLTHLLLSDV
jgi:hypothetical protein